MSLQRRIAAASAIGVAAVCLILVPVGYLSTRAKMYQEVKLELRRIAAPYLQPPHPQGGENGPNGISVPGRHNAPPGTPNGGDGDKDNATRNLHLQAAPGEWGWRARRDHRLPPGGLPQRPCGRAGWQAEAAGDPRGEGGCSHAHGRLLLHDGHRRHARGDLRGTRPRRIAM